MHPQAGHSASSALSIEEAARRIRSYEWVEMRLFEVLGGWVETTPELDVRMVLVRHCYHHAWHAQLWHDVRPGLAPAAPIQPQVVVNEHLQVLIGALGQPIGPEGTLDKLVGVYRVLLPATLAAYEGHLTCTSPLTDGPTVRCLELVLGDERHDVREGESLLKTLIRTPADLARARSRQDALEAIWGGPQAQLWAAEAAGGRGS